MTAASSRMGILNLLVVIVLHNNIRTSEGLRPNLTMHDLLDEILTSLPWSLRQIEEVSPPGFDTLHYLVKQSNSSKTLYMDFFDQPQHINEQYEELHRYKTSTADDKIRFMNLYSFANRYIDSSFDPKLWDRLDKFIKTIDPNSRHEGIFHMYSTYIKDRGDQWCGERQSVSSVIYGSFRYSLNIIMKGYSIILQSYIIRKDLDPVPSYSFSNYFIHKNWYVSTIRNMFEIFKQLEIGASTRIVPCHPRIQVGGSTYLEMEKLLQGVLPQEITLNEKNSAKGGCEDYGDQGTAYYPYKNIRHDGDWKCHGLMYNCFKIPQNIDICKPSRLSRRFDGIADVDMENFSIYEVRYEGMGRTYRCSVGEKWTLFDWRYPMPFSTYELEQCACVCDDFEHPRTLRKFSREYVMADFKNNMVVTGIRLVNISNVIHIQIQEGKLGEYGFINPSTVKWRLKNDIVNRREDLSSRNSDEVVTLSYHKRRVNLGQIHFETNAVVIGVAFDWDKEGKGVELLVFGTVFSFSTGKLSQDYRIRHAPSESREEIVLENISVPELCDNNVAVKGDNHFIKFQTTDWLKDAAQTTIPYLDIQEVATSPPIMLRGIGLYYKKGDLWGESVCGGYIGFELYSHGNELFSFYNDTLY